MNFKLIDIFQHLRDESLENLFHTSDEQRIPIKMMKACGYFRNANITKYNVQAVEFPYDVRLRSNNFLFLNKIKSITNEKKCTKITHKSIFLTN